MTGYEGVGVVFDCDGVLADTNPCWDAAFADVASEFGLALSQDRLSRLRGAALGLTFHVLPAPHFASPCTPRSMKVA